MIIEFEGESWDFDLKAITLQQAIRIEEAYGFTLNDWLSALENASGRALQCLYWLMLQQQPGSRSTGTPIKKIDCEIIALADAFGKAKDAEDAASDDGAGEAEPDPTPPSPSRPQSPQTAPHTSHLRDSETAPAGHRTGS